MADLGHDPVSAVPVSGLETAQPAAVTFAQGSVERPVLRRALATAVVVASGLFAAPFTPAPAETVTVDKWHAPLSVPARRPAGLPTGEQRALAFVKASLFPETVTVSRWLRPLAEPFRRLPQLGTGARQYSAPFTPAPDETVAGSDVRSDSGPIFGRTIIFPSRFAPVVVPSAAEVVTADKWYAPFSTPTRARATPPAQQEDAFLSTAEVVTGSKWFAELSSPQRQRIGLAVRHQQAVVFVKASPFEEAVSLDRWLQPLAEPVRVRPRLGTGAQQHLALVQAAPFAETVSADRWLQPLAAPVRKTTVAGASGLLWAPFTEAAAVTVSGSDVCSSGGPIYGRTFIFQSRAAPVFVAEVVTADKWYAPFSTPARTRASPSAQQEDAFLSTEDVTVAKWLAPFAEPVRAKPRVQPGGYVPYVAPTSEVVTLDKWFFEFSTPQRPRIGLAAWQQQATAFTQAAPFAEAVSIDRWQQPLADPVRVRPRLATPSQQHLAFVKADPFPEATDAGKWFAPLGEPPVKARAALAAARQQYLAFAQPEDVTVSRWLAPLSDPVRTRPALRTAAHQYVAWVQGAPFAESVSVDRWLLGLSEPYRPRIGLATRLQQATAFWPFPLANLDAPAWACALYPDRAPGRVLATAHQQALAFVKAAPFAETASADRWTQQLSQPTLRKRQVQSEGAYYTFAETVTADRWAQPPSQPTRRAVSAAWQQAGIIGSALPIVAGADSWLQAFGQPTRRLANAGWQQAGIAGPATPLVAGPDRWLQALVQPAAAKRWAQPDGAWNVALAAEPVTADKWFAPWQAPARRVQQRPAGFVALAPVVEASVAVWWQPASQPVLRKAFAQGYQAAVAGPALPYVASPDRWLAAFAEPVRLGTRPVGHQPAVIGLQAVAADWLQALAQPAWRIGRQQAGEYAAPYVASTSPDFESVEWLVPLAEPRLRIPSVASWQAFVFNHIPILVLPTPERRTVHARDRDRVIAASGPGRVIVVAVDVRAITPEGRGRTIRARLTDRKIITE